GLPTRHDRQVARLHHGHAAGHGTVEEYGAGGVVVLTDLENGGRVDGGGVDDDLTGTDRGGDAVLPQIDVTNRGVVGEAGDDVFGVGHRLTDGRRHGAAGTIGDGLRLLLAAIPDRHGMTRSHDR